MAEQNTQKTHHERVVTFLRRTAREIEEISRGTGLTEKQVRHAIGVARGRGFDIRRDSLRKFSNLGRKSATRH